MKINPKKNYIFWTVIIVLHLIYFIWQINHRLFFLEDSQEYLLLADNIKKGILYCGDLNQPLNFDFFTRRPPLYSILICLTHSHILLIAFQSGLSILNIYGVTIMLKHAGIKTYSKIFFIIILVLCPSQFIYSNMIMSEILLQTILVWAFIFFVIFIKHKKINYLILCNSLLAVGLLTKPILLLLVFPNFLFVSYLAFREKKTTILLPALIPILVLLAYCTYNYKRTHYFHFSSIQTTVLLHYNVYLLLNNLYGENRADKEIDAIEIRANALPDYASHQKYREGESVKIIMSHKVLYSKFLLKGCLNFFLDPGRFDIYKFFDLEVRDGNGLLFYFSKDGYKEIFNYLQKQSLFIVSVLLLVLFANIYLLISFLYILCNKRIEWEIRFFMFLLIAFIAFGTAFMGAMRFKVPIYPLLLFSGVYMITTIQQRGKIKKSRI